MKNLYGDFNKKLGFKDILKLKIRNESLMKKALLVFEWKMAT